MTTMLLRLMKKHQHGSIARIKGGGEIGLRIREMGLVPGAEIEVVGRAPLKDPVHLKLNGASLTLRNSEADHIMVETAGVSK